MRNSFSGPLLLLFAAAPVAAAVSSETVTSLALTSTNGAQSSIAWDAQNNVHIAYFDPSSSLVRYAKLTNSTWAISSPAGTSTAFSSSTALALDSLLQAHIVTHASLTGDLRWTPVAGGGSLIETVPSTAPFLSLAMDAANRPRVLYNVTSSTAVKFASFDGVLEVTL